MQFVLSKGLAKAYLRHNHLSRVWHDRLDDFYSILGKNMQELRNYSDFMQLTTLDAQTVQRLPPSNLEDVEVQFFGLDN